MNKRIVAAALGFLVSMTARGAIVETFDANAAFRTNELDPATETNSTFGLFSVGYGENFGDFTAFTPDQHENTFAGNADTQGFHVFNNFIVPAAVVNVGSAPGFAGLNPGEILLHPGGIGANAGEAPYHNGLLRFVAPAAGFYTINGNFRSLDGGVTENNILRTDASNVTTSLASIIDGGGFKLTVQLAPSERIYFSVGAGPDGIGGDSTGLTATLSRSDTPPPVPPATTKVNIDFNGKRPGDTDSAGTFVGQGGAGGGTTFNGVTADSTAGDDNLMVSAAAGALLNDQGQATTVAFTLGPVGGDANPDIVGPVPDPTDPRALFGDYVFTGSAGNPAGPKPFMISGLGNVATANLYFYAAFARGTYTIGSEIPDAFVNNGIFTANNTTFFADVPVMNGTITGTFDGAPGVLSGLTVEFVPEPGAALLLAFGGIGTLLRRHRIA